MRQQLRKRSWLLSWLALVVLGAAAIAALARAERVYEPWPLATSRGDISLMRASESTRQVVELGPGALRGFAAAVRIPSAGSDPVLLNLRIREVGQGNRILREKRVEVQGAGGHEVTTGVMPAVIPADPRRAVLEVEVDPASPGAATVLRSERENVPRASLTINGAATDAGLRANVAPVMSASTRAMVERLLEESPLGSTLYLIAAVAGALTSMMIAADALRRITGRRLRRAARAAILLTAGPLTLLALAVGTLTLRVGSDRHYLLELRDSYWGGALGLVMLLGLSTGGLWILTRWTGWRGMLSLGAWRRARWVLWRWLIGAAIWSLLVGLPLKLWGQEEAAQSAGAVSLVLLTVGVAIAMLMGLKRAD